MASYATNTDSHVLWFLQVNHRYTLSTSDNLPAKSSTKKWKAAFLLSCSVVNVNEGVREQGL